VHIGHILAATPPPAVILQWAQEYDIEDVISWLLQADEENALTALNASLESEFATLSEFTVHLKTKANNGGAKDDLLAHEEIASVMFRFPACIERTRNLLHSLVGVMQSGGATENWVADNRSNADTCVLRWSMA